MDPGGSPGIPVQKEVHCQKYSKGDGAYVDHWTLTFE